MRIDTKNQEIFNYFNITDAEASRAAKSTGYLQPGDLVLFQYSGQQRFCFVTRTKNRQSLWLSSRGNTLVACFQLQNLSSETMEILIPKLYKNRKITYQQTKKGLTMLFGENNFRTFNTLKIADLYEITLNG